MRIRPATMADATAITTIYNEAVATSTASFDTELDSLASRQEWLMAHGDRHPVLVAEHSDTVIGWGALSRYSERHAYSATAEISLYVSSAAQQQGAGRALALALVESARRKHIHAIIARVCSENTASIALMNSLGFENTGTMREVGYKFGRWLDVITFEYLLRP